MSERGARGSRRPARFRRALAVTPAGSTRRYRFRPTDTRRHSDTRKQTSGRQESRELHEKRDKVTTNESLTTTSSDIHLAPQTKHSSEHRFAIRMPRRGSRLRRFELSISFLNPRLVYCGVRLIELMANALSIDVPLPFFYFRRFWNREQFF